VTAKSDRIKRLLEDQDLREAFENVRNKYRAALENEQILDDDVLEIRRMLFLTHKVEQDLNTAMEDGQLEDFRANEQERPSFLGDLWNKRH
jgi:hypothetical protein